MNLPGRFGRWCALPLWVRAAACAAAAGSASTAALAAPPTRVATRLSWGASVCGDAQGFASRVSKRTRAVRFVESGEQLTVRLSIAPEGSGLDATVSLTSKGREPIVRHIASPDCDDALDALALVVAISVEARSREALRRAPPRRPRPAPPRPAPAPEGSAPSPGPAMPVPAPSEVLPEPVSSPQPASPATGVEAVPPAPPAEGPASSPEPAPSASAGPTQQEAERTVEAPGSVVPSVEPPAVATDIQPSTQPSEPPALDHFAFASGVAAQLLAGAGPQPLLGAQLWVRGRWERSSPLSPELGLSIAYQRRDGFDEGAGQADFALTAATLDVCPVRLGSAAWHVQPCAAGALGRLESKGHATFFPGAAQRPWATLGGNVQLVARFDRLEIRGSLGVARPLVRDSFRFGPSCAGASCEADIFHRVEPVVWLAALGAGVNF